MDAMNAMDAMMSGAAGHRRGGSHTMREIPRGFGMKIVFFGNSTEKNAAIRYRVLHFAAMLRQEGHECVVCLPSSVRLRERFFEGRSRWLKLLYLMLVALRRIGQVRHVAGGDVVFMRGPLFDYGPPVLERVVHRLNPRVVFDIDDAIWEPPAHVDSPFLRFVDFGWVRKMAGMCAHAVVGNRVLEQYVRECNPGMPITVIPTCIDMARHAQKTYDDAAGRPVRLGWTGLADNLGYLNLIAEPLRALAQRHNIVLCVASGADYHLDGVRVENQRWRMDEEFDYLRDADIGLMPLADTPRARGKCAFKALQYMGVGTPVVISPVGMNAEVVEDGVTGFLADTPEAWRDKLERLITTPDLRRRMGMAARESIRRRYAHDVHFPAFLQALESAAARRR